MEEGMMSELSVDFVTPHMRRCGIYTYSRSLINGLVGRGVDCYVTRFPRFGKKTDELLGLTAARVPEDVDLIHLQHEYGLFKGHEGAFYNYLRRHDLPIISTCHAVGNFKVDSIISSVSDRVIVHNEFCQDKFSYPSTIIPHGCKPTETLPVEECKTALHVNPEIPVVGYLGFITEYKGLETLIEAMIDVPEAALVIGGGYHAGSGTVYMQKLKQRSFKLLPKRVSWLGYVDEKDIPLVYGAADCVVYPSRWTTESGALLMALSHGKATISSSLTPFKEKEEEGALMTFEDVPDLSEKIKLVLGDDDLREQLERGAMSYAKSNSWNKVAGKHVKLYREVLADAP